MDDHTTPDTTLVASLIRLTLALNTNRSQRTPILLPSAALLVSLADPSSAHSLVLNHVRTKLCARGKGKKVPKPQRVFVARDGRELLCEEDWKRYVRRDAMLVISCGEDFVGVRRGVDTEAEELERDRQNDEKEVADSTLLIQNDQPLRMEVLARNAQVDTQSLAQFRTTTEDLQGIFHAVAQPDLHPGNKHPIGAVFVSKGWIHSPLIGSDIGCGMAWYRTKLSRSAVEGDKGKRIANGLRGLEGAWRTESDRKRWLMDREGEDCSAGEEWDRAVGTIGAGNHFAEVQVVEASTIEGMHEGEVVLLVHSGSRGYGGSVLKRFSKGEAGGFKEGSADADAYLEAHDRACRWARANRDLIALRFLSCLEPGDPTWSLGRNDCVGEELNVGLEEVRSRLRERQVVDIWHNNVEKVIWPPRLSVSSEHEHVSDTDAENDHPQEHAYIHRKGAAPTCIPGTTTPLRLLPLPGSRGTATMILSPTFSASTDWGLKNGFSLAHGAGRSMSRGKALSSLSAKYKHKNLLEPSGKNGIGTWVICDEKDLVYEEAPEAYKDVRAVADDLVEAGAARVVGWCRPVVSYKVRCEWR